MASYLIGDLQGCCTALQRLLNKIGYSPSQDHVYLLGDLVNRGPASLATLRLLQGLGESATCLLGNHDLHLLAVAHGARPASRSDTLGDILSAPDRPALLEWLRRQRMAVFEKGWLLVHAGVVPQWDAVQTLALAGEVEAVLRSPELPAFLHTMYSNEPDHWDEALTGPAQLRFIVNVLTRIRFCDASGRLDFKTKDGAGAAPAGFTPWFDAPARRTATTPMAFGHWSTLGLVNRPELLALDTGCVWGGRLSAMRVDGGRRELVQVDCKQAQRPAKNQGG